MKQTLILAAIFLLFFNGKAQRLNYKITYRHCVQFDTILKLKDNFGVQAILLGNEKATNYSFDKQANSIVQNQNEKTLEQIINAKQQGTFKLKNNSLPSDSIGNIVYHNKLTDSIFVREKMKNNYVITEEKWEPIRWAIEAEKKIMQKYSCQKATAYFRGRNYTAWFTTELPIVAAPWKFYGLPGLLMSIEDDKEQVKIYVEKIQYPVAEEIHDFVANGIKISLAKYFILRNEDFKRETLAMQAILDNQEHMKEIIASGEARPVVKIKGAPYCIEKRAD